MKARLPALVVTALFGAGFLVAGLFGGVLPLAEAARTAWASRSWQPVPATVLATDLDVGRRDVRQARVRYRYPVGGRTYEGTRIGVHRTGGDNVGEWQRDWHARLARAQRQQRPVTAWADPADPARAVLDRRIRWPLAALHLPFALVFTAVGAIASWAFLYLLVTPEAALQARQQPDVKQALDRRARDIALALFAAAWLLLALPFTAIAWTGPEPVAARAGTALFTLAGLWLAQRAWQRSQRPAEASLAPGQMP